jgi:hypothetical protein
MSFEFDFSSVPDDPSKIQDGNGERVTPGRGMALITAWNEYGGVKGQAHELELEIVAWSHQADIAKVHKENIFHKDSTGKGFPMKRMTCLALAAGLFNANDVKSWKASGTQPAVDMQKLVGRPIMIELVEEPDKNDASKKYIRIGNIGLAFYHIKDKRVEAWPKNTNIFNQNALKVGEWITETKPVAKTEQRKQEPATAAAGAADPFNALG